VPSAAYLSAIPRGLGGPSLRAGDLGLQLSRGFKALKVWMSLREAGVARYRDAIEANLSLARTLEQRVREAPDLELAHPSDLAIVCFRYRPAGTTERSEAAGRVSTVTGDGEETYADRVNREILMTLHERGIAAPSHTVLRNRFYMRCAITNHRTRSADLGTLLDAVRELGRSLEASGELERVETAP
jgi:glutamate/tyrosine decarboxylase-like PLP-dependent enzyme